jgi:chorismate synthase
MAGNSIGEVFRLTTFGESHGTQIGAVIDGCPAGILIDAEFIQQQMDKRKPGQSHLVTQRMEGDRPEIISGVFEGVTTGTPLAALLTNENARSKDYDEVATKYRPSHADFTYDAKFGQRDYRGGGRSSARETACRVFAGSIAQLFLKANGIRVDAYVSQVGTIRVPLRYSELDLESTWKNLVHCPHVESAAKMQTLIEEVRKAGDTIGGLVTGVIRGCPAGLGEPVFDRLHADLGKAMLSINAAKGFEYGAGFSGITLRGSQINDAYVQEAGRIQTRTNHSGGVQGGISNGMDIYFNVAFKPVATIMHEQDTVDITGAPTQIKGKGRHDPCVLPRAVAIVEAMAALTITDHFLRHRLSRADWSKASSLDVNGAGQSS